MYNMNNFFLLLITQLSSIDSCDTMYSQHMTTDMALSYQQFDQTMGNGFRPLAKPCPKHAIKLLKNYIIINNATEKSLRWHIAQILGEVGQIKEAEMYALSTINDSDEGDFKWNDYVLGYIAYWKKDIETLKLKIATLESNSAHQGNSINAKLLKKFFQEINNP